MKKWLKLLIIAMMMLTFGGCSKPVDSTEEDVEIVIWHTFTDAQNEELEKIAADFSATHEHIKVTIEQQPYADFDSKVANAVRSGVGPSLIIHYSTLAASFAEEDLLIDFMPYIEADEGLAAYKDGITAGAYTDATQFDNGTKMYLYPLTLTANLLFYNKTLFDELGLTAPTTWDELTSDSQTIYQNKGIPGFGMDSLTDNFILWLNQNHITYIDSATKTVGFNDTKTVDLLDWFSTGVQGGYFSIAPTGNYYSEDFGAQTIAAYIGSCAGASYVEASVGDKFEWAMAPVPQTDTAETITTAFIRGAIGFTKDDAHDQAVYEFLKYWTSADVHAEWCATYNALSPYSATTAIAAYQTFLSDNESMAIAQQGVQYGIVSPSLPGSATVRTEIDALIKKVCLGDVSIEEALKLTTDNSNAALAE